SRPPPRVPRAHGHQRWSSCVERPPREGPREAFGVSPKAEGMTPPEAAATGPMDQGAGSAPAVCVCLDGPAPIDVLRKRADFLRAAQARRQATPGFLLQARQ